MAEHEENRRVQNVPDDLHVLALFCTMLRFRACGAWSKWQETQGKTGAVGED